MLPRLSIPDWRSSAGGGAEEEAEGGGWDGVDETPRDPPSLPSLQPAGSLPSSPSARKTKSRAARNYTRTDSLKDAKVLVVSEMHRTESAMDPSLFQYHQHFESPWQLVGKTHLSEVFRVRHRVSGEAFAVKRSRRRFRSKLQRERCLREIRAVAELPSHPNIVNQYRAWQEGGHFYIQMDFCEGGTLAHWAHKACADGQCMSDELLWSTACQAAQGLCFLHSHDVLHLDIKPENLYLSHGAWRIGDFGLAVARDKEGSMDWEEGDGDYVAPELLRARGEPSPASDIFSLGATLFECATGRKLPRFEGWVAGDAERLEVPGRPPAFVELLRAMLQLDPAQRPTAEQIVASVAREEPEIATAAAEPVSAMAAAAAAAATHFASPLAGMQVSPGSVALVPSPFNQPAAELLPTSKSMAAARQQAARKQAARADVAAEAAAEAAAGPSHFSFNVPQAKPSTSFTFTGQPLHHHHNQRPAADGLDQAPPGTAVKGTPGRQGRLGGRWAPALSPLISEGALTPGAFAALAGLTPSAAARPSSGEGAPTPVLFGGGSGGGRRSSSGGSGSGGRLSAGASPLDMRRPAPLQLPPQTGAPCVLLPSPGTQQISSSGTQDSREGWRLSRRDILSPGSEAAPCSQYGSEYSYSCGTGRTMSDLEFPDALSSPMSQELAGLLPFASGRTHTPSTGGTPDSLLLHRHRLEGREGSNTPDTDLQQGSAQVHTTSVGRPGIAGHLMQVGPSLAWDLHTSPEFLMQLPPGSPHSLSRSSSLDDAASLPSSRGLSVRRFPTLDSWGSQLDGASSKPPPRLDSMAALAAQRFTNTFATEQQAAAQQAQQQEVAPTDGSEGADAPAAAGRAQRKRQHSSRRTLMQALSRDNSVASSIDGMQPLGKSRHISDSPDAGADLAGQQRLLMRSGSTLGREAAAAAAAMAAEITKATAAADAAAGASAAATPCHRAFSGLFGEGGAAAAGAACSPFKAHSSPLHARMTCMKLRDTDTPD